MAAISSAPPWNTEDDLLLKYAVEGGASLEALAKGAVQFSRKFSFRELQDRWHSLLYDNDVAAQAAVKMTDYELNGPNISFKASKFGISKVCGNSSPLKRRRPESIRRQYNDMRKKLCAFNTFDLSFIDEPIAHDESMNIGNELLNGNYMVEDRVEDYFGFPEGGQNEEIITDTDLLLLENQENDNGRPNVSDQRLLGSGDGMIEFQNCQSADELGTSHVLQDTPLWKTLEDVSAPEMPIDADLDVKTNSEESLIHHGGEDGGKLISSPLILGEGLPDSEINRSISLLGDDFADISDSLLNFTNENENLALEVERESLTGKTLRSSLPEEEAYSVVQPETSDSTILQAVSEDVNNTEKKENTNMEDTPQVVDIPSSTTLLRPDSPEYYFELMECTLNTEDPEIPCNDELWAIGSGDLGSSLTNGKSTAQESVSSKKDENPMTSTTSQMLGQRTVPKTNPSLQLVGFTAKPDPDGNGVALISQQANVVLIDGSQSIEVASPKFGANQVLKQKGIKAPVSCREEHALVTQESGATNTGHLEPDANQYQDESEEEPDNYHLTPYVSDIENMILDMDLSPDDDESLFKSKVSRYQHEDAKRKILRLEQSARSSTQRAIASKGAFAVFYGRHLKKYIKKTEVLLGRATEDNEVDIDLGEEGRANKISRRQALIKLEGDGSFFLKNIGKSSIFLNGKEVVTGHRMCLGSSNLIEITGMSFVFDMNHKYIRRYLLDSGQNGREKHSKLEWSSPKGN